MQKKIIIGIHGLRNKPSHLLLKLWWKKSIRDGLRGIGKDRLFFSFEMAYWASVLHDKPLSVWARNPDNPRHIREPYRRFSKDRHKKPGFLRRKFLDAVRKSLEVLFLNKDRTMNFSKITEKLIQSYFEDLSSYFSNEKHIHGHLVRDLIRTRLSKIIRKHQGKKILLIAHSMGSYIAYDVLTHCVPDVAIDTFITIGSPLGLPVFISKMASSMDSTNNTKPVVPKNILNHWYNLADLNDKIALDYCLKNNFLPNRGAVGVQDLQVYNDFTIQGDRNPHKSYGYLRAAEMARIIDSFLTH